jgi:hypothetical protein
MTKYLKITTVVITAVSGWFLLKHITDALFATYIIGLVAGLVFNIVIFWDQFNKPKPSSLESFVNSSKIEDLQNVIDEQREVIDSYESMLDEQLVEVECDCGKPLFKGILIPNQDNLCVCGSCKENYKILIEYNKILVAQPLNDEQIFNNLTANVEKK